LDLLNLAIFIAAYLIMAVPLTLSRIIAAFNNILNDEDLSSADVLRASIYIFALAIQLITIYWSGSRGPWLGLFVGLFAFVLIMLVSVRNAASGTSRFKAVDALKAVGLMVIGASVTFFLVSLLLRAVVSTGRLPSLGGPIGSFAAFVAALAIPVLIIFVMAAARRGWRWLWLSWIVLALVVGVWIVAFNLPSEVTEPYAEVPLVGQVVATLDEWRELPNIGRFGRILEADDGTGRVRTLIWAGALKLILPHEPLEFPEGGRDIWNFIRPLIGYGPESMYVAYNRFYPPELATLEARNASPDRSHNETFDALVITGLFGFAMWQFLYITVFYYGFRWLGVLRSRRERNLLIILWLGMGLLAAVLFSLWRGPEYIGVAYPFGSIGGLVLYLIYYALFSQASEPETEDEEADPFSANRLLIVGLLAGVLAHYVEIHFGIAIAATRLYFFVYLALMLVVGYVLPRVGSVGAETAVSLPVRSKKRRAAQPVGDAKEVWGPAFLSALMLALMLGIIGFTFTNYSPPPGVTFDSPADLPVLTIFRQSLFINPGDNFSNSPFIFMLMLLTWSLGVLLIIAEMAKSGELVVTPETALAPEKQRITGIVFVVLGAAAIALRFFPAPANADTTWALGHTLLPVVGVFCLYVGARLLLGLPQARFWAGGVALAVLAASLPILVAGSVWLWLGTAVTGLLLLWFIWQKEWRRSLLPAGVIALLSFAIGVSYTYVQAAMLKASLFVPRTKELVTQADLLEFRVYEAGVSASFLTLFYAFVFSLMIFAAFAAARSGMARVKETGSAAGYASLAGLALLGIFLISLSNMRVIQADMIYKRAKPFDQQAASQRDKDLWDVAIAIYDRAINLAPTEDFYYLFLGRAFLERSTITEDNAERDALLQEAEQRLKVAQSINPLNTDHTANLARLNTRWVELSSDAAAQEARKESALSYYQDAMALSPQNSLIRSEYARFLYGLEQDCAAALAAYDEAIEMDPYFNENFFGRADTRIACAAELAEAERDAAYDAAIADLEAGLALGQTNARAMLRVGQLNQDIGRYEAAIAAYEAARPHMAAGGIPDWNIDYLIATVYEAQGKTDLAVAAAEAALAQAPPETAPQLQAYIQQLTGAPVETIDPQTLSGERPLTSLPPAARDSIYSQPPPIVLAEGKTYDAIIETEKGSMRLRLFADAAPIAVNNFVFLANQGFYDGTSFHRVLADFMVQGGDPTGTGGGGPGYQFADETGNGLTFDRPGLLAMANSGPNTNGSQFFITLAPTPWLDGLHTIFGELVEGQDVLNALTLRDPQSNPTTPGDAIVRITIEEGSE
jgi:cyclophilin family peptidyl-prolyl cis-trans isomerase/tetratricopeptide (TPR) repeat protein